MSACAVTEGTVVLPHTPWVGAPTEYKLVLTPDEVAWLKKSADKLCEVCLAVYYRQTPIH